MNIYQKLQNLGFEYRRIPGGFDEFGDEYDEVVDLTEMQLETNNSTHTIWWWYKDSDCVWNYSYNNGEIFNEFTDSEQLLKFVESVIFSLPTQSEV